MELKIIRENKGPKATIGKLYVDGVLECFTLEDKVRQLGTKGEGKIKGHTAIPEGNYKVVLNVSNRFKRYMPQVLNVPFFEGIRIHAGNTDADTEGCILVGRTNPSGTTIGQSLDAYRSLMKKLEAAEKKEKISIEIR